MASFPDTTVIRGSGSLYWNGGMRLAWTSALNVETDFFLWLNDDLELLPGSIEGLVDLYQREAQADPKVLVVGRVKSVDKLTDTYGGRVRASHFSRLRFRGLEMEERLCDTMNGNCVLIPTRAVADIGVNSEHFTHAMGDMDYGLRAQKAGYRIFQSDFPVGYQDKNPHNYARPKSNSWRDVSEFMKDPKGMPIKEWLYFCRTHGGWLWPINFTLMYARALLPRPRQ
ncbi:glycosyltransferase family 2 protein [Caulobacter segnis]